MTPTSSARRIPFVIAALLILATAASAQQRETGAVAGIAVGEDGQPVAGATVVVARTDGTQPRTATSDARGAFNLPDLAPGLYRVSARRIGFREARLPVLRVIAGQTAEVRVTLAASPTQLSTVEVTASPTSIDAGTAEIARRIEIADVQLVPMGRDAASLVDLVPGSRRGFVWGGAGDGANNYQLDGVAVNHPGTGGDFLAPSIDWIESLEVRGLGAGAEHGGFQGGIINAVTRTGTNDWRGALRTTYVSPGMTASNIQPNEEGAEQSMRRELSGVMQGPIFRDRLFYFIGGVHVDRRIQVPDLITADPSDVRSTEQELTDVRGIAKLTYRPGPLDRIDALVGHTDNRMEYADLNGLDDPASSLRVRSPTTFYEAGWKRTGLASSFDARLAGFSSRETRDGYAGQGVPGVQVFTRGRQPVFQNALFTDHVEPSSIAGHLSWTKDHPVGRGSNKFVAGLEYSRGSWKKERTRNGGLTWLPYVNPTTMSVNPADATSWPDVASEWGGEIRIDSEVEDMAVFVQDYLTISPRLTITPGVRYGRWSGWLTPGDGSGAKFLAVRDQAVDPRIGVVWDVSGRNDLVLKLHWGLYHQAMSSLFFDRAEGGNAYTNERFYFQGPPLSDPRTVFTPEQRDANIGTFTGFSPTWVETPLNEAGRVEDYRQPYVNQAIISAEKRFGPRWKAELSFTARSNRNIVGLVDRNLEQNYSPIYDVVVRDRVLQTPVYDQDGVQLVIPVLWVSNRDLRNELISRSSGLPVLPPVPGYTFADINTLTFDPDIVLTTVPGAKRSMQQITASVRTEQGPLDWFGSVSYTNLKGNVAGLTGFGTIGSDFTAGPEVRRNERINFEGRLPNIPAFDAKMWITGDLPGGIQAGAFFTATLGEYMAPTFRITPRFRFLDETRRQMGDNLVAGIMGQTILLEERGSRKYPASHNLDLRMEKRVKTRVFDAVFSGDLFNATSSDAITQRNLTVNDGTTTDPTSVFGAVRRRVSPMRLQIGLRIEH